MSLTAPMPKSMADYLDHINQVVKPYLTAQGIQLTPINVREALALMTHTLVTDAPVMAKTIDTMLTTPVNFRGYNVPLRLFLPQDTALPNKASPVNVPVVVFFHGGGGMAGSVSVYDKIYKKLAASTGAIVVAPEYRLAPENRYPAAIDDAHTVLQYLSATLQTVGYSINDTLIVGGDSGGGAIAATLVQDWLANRVNTDLVISHQLLIYAGLDYTLSQPSMQTDENGTGYLLERDKIVWYYDNYFSRYEDRELVSPFWTDLSALAYHTTKPLPKSLSISAGYCPLRDEDIGYHEQLAKAGFDSELLHFPEMIHAFINMENLCPTQCRQLYKKIATFIQSTQD